MDFFAPPFYGHCTNAKLWFLKCIAKEADMICELLRRDAHPVDDYLISQGTAMRSHNCISQYGPQPTTGIRGQS
jgi:hypothetical protein